MFAPNVSLDLSKNTSLKDVYKYGGQELISINIKNRNNVSINHFEADGGNLECVQVDNVPY